MVEENRRNKDIDFSKLDLVDKIILLAEKCEREGKDLRDFIRTLRFAHGKY